MTKEQLPGSSYLPNEVTPETPVEVNAAKIAREMEPQVAGLKPQDVLHADKVFVVGQIGYDFGTEARLDYFTQVMGGKASHPFDPVHMATHLLEGDNIEQSNAMTWTLKIDGIPVYAIEPENQFVVLQYQQLVNFLYDQEKNGVERISIAGTVIGETRLFNGQIVPTIAPVLRGMFNWRSRDLATAVMSAASVRDIGTQGSKSNNLPDVASSQSQSEAIKSFLDRVYYELRNRGSSSSERALNYAATNAYQMSEVFCDALEQNLFLNKISAVESPVSRPDSDCWDVVLEFFNPKERLTSARKLYRYTIDVSDIMPVTVGELRSWHAY